MINNEVIKLTKKLIQFPSITPNDANLMEFLIEILNKYNFKIRSINSNGIKNIYATHGDQQPNLCFAGHVDVVPLGNIDDWKFPPFDGYIENNFIFGRGACDMKGNLAAFIIAICNFIKKYPKHKGTLSILITSDEEGKAEFGTKLVVETLKKENKQIDFCIVGEPTSSIKICDVIKNGRRGSLNGKIEIFGKQGHIAYPHLAKNPIHLFSKALNELTNKKWDLGNDFFDPTSFQISSIKSGISENVIPNVLEFTFNFRFSPETNEEKLKNEVEKILKNNKLIFQSNWKLSGKPFITKPDFLIEKTRKIIFKHLNYNAKLSTSGGTSDGRFISQICTQVIELGCINETIHKINECVSIQDLIILNQIYEDIIIEILEKD